MSTYKTNEMSKRIASILYSLFGDIFMAFDSEKMKRSVFMYCKHFMSSARYSGTEPNGGGIITVHIIKKAYSNTPINNQRPA